MSGFRGLITQPVLTKMHGLVDEQYYFVANDAQTAIATGTGTSFSATAPYLLIENNNSAPSAGQAAINVLPDYLRLTCTAAGSAASGLTYVAFALYIDNTMRFSSGGTLITPAYNPNMNSANASNAKIYAGTPTATAASANVRPIVGGASLRPCVSGTVICAVGDQFVLDFGSLEGGMAGTITVASPVMLSIPIPPIEIGPQMSGLLYVWYPGGATVAAPSFLTELGYFER